MFLEKIPKLDFDEKSAKFAGKIYRDLRSRVKVSKVKDLLIASSASLKNSIHLRFRFFREYGLKLKVLK